jgi:hypothetical protein
MKLPENKRKLSNPKKSFLPIDIYLNILLFPSTKGSFLKLVYKCILSPVHLGEQC